MKDLAFIVEAFFFILKSLAKTLVISVILYNQWYLIRNRIIRDEKKEKWLYIPIVILLSVAIYEILRHWILLSYITQPFLDGVIFATLSTSAFILFMANEKMPTESRDVAALYAVCMQPFVLMMVQFFFY